MKKMLKETQHHIHSTEQWPQAILGPTSPLGSLGLRPPCQRFQKVSPKSAPVGTAAALHWLLLPNLGSQTYQSY